MSWTRTASKPHDCMAAMDEGLASWSPSKMECSVTQAYSVPDVSAPRSTTTFPDPLTRWSPSTLMESVPLLALAVVVAPAVVALAVVVAPAVGGLTPTPSVAATDAEGVATSTVENTTPTAVNSTASRPWRAPGVLVMTRPGPPGRADRSAARGRRHPGGRWAGADAPRGWPRSKPGRRSSRRRPWGPHRVESRQPAPAQHLEKWGDEVIDQPCHFVVEADGLAGRVVEHDETLDALAVVGDVEELVDPDAHRLNGRGSVDHQFGDVVDIRPGRRAEHGEQQVVLGLELTVERTGGQAGIVEDVLDAGAEKPVSAHDLERRIHELSAFRVSRRGRRGRLRRGPHGVVGGPGHERRILALSIGHESGTG